MCWDKNKYQHLWLFPVLSAELMSQGGQSRFAEGLSLYSSSWLECSYFSSSLCLIQPWNLEFPSKPGSYNPALMCLHPFPSSPLPALRSLSFIFQSLYPTTDLPAQHHCPPAVTSIAVHGCSQGKAQALLKYQALEYHEAKGIKWNGEMLLHISKSRSKIRQDVS